MSDNNSPIQISKTRFTTMWIGLLALVVALAICILQLLNPPVQPPPPPLTTQSDVWIDDGKDMPVDEELKEFLADGNYEKLILVRGDTKVKLVRAPGGEVLEPCGEGYMFKGCGLERVEPLSWNHLFIIEFKRSPGPTCAAAGPWGFC
jgi:hypothetical protein